jgi:hypothetical protein
MRIANESRANRNNSPSQEDSGNQPASTPFLDDDGSGNLQQEISNEEYPCSETVDFRREPEVTSHLKRCVANIDAIKVGDDVEQEQKWEKALAYAAPRSIPD